MQRPLLVAVAVLVVLLCVAAYRIHRLGAERQRLHQRLMRCWVREQATAQVIQAERRRTDALLMRLARVQGSTEQLA